MAPDDVLEDLADVLRLVERRDDGADGVRPDLVPAFDELDELVHDRTGGGDPVVGPFDRQLVPAQAERAVQPVAQRVEHAVADSPSSAATSFGTDRTSCTRLSVGGRSDRPGGRPLRLASRRGCQSELSRRVRVEREAPSEPRASIARDRRLRRELWQLVDPRPTQNDSLTPSRARRPSARPPSTSHRTYELVHVRRPLRPARGRPRS